MTRPARPVARLACLAVAGVLVLTIPPARAADAPPPWQAVEHRDHPLVGRIWRAADGAFVGRGELAKALAAAHLVLLGETHDNPDHHRIQAWAVGRVVDAGHRPGIAMEMIATDRQGLIEAHFAARPGDAAGLGAALDWDRTGWPAWRHYAAAIAPAVAAGGAMTAANLPQATIRAVARQGFAALGAERLAELGLDRPLAEPLYGEVAKEMVASHCGQIAEARARPFALMQIARDAALADGLLIAAQRAKGRAVLLAGSGHVRIDRGVPMHLARRGRGQGVLALAPIEVAPGRTRPQAYAEAYGAAELPFDYVWFTPRETRDDPCVSFKKSK